MTLCISHLNIPARDPYKLAEWYVKVLRFRQHGKFLWAGETLLTLERGKPIGAQMHFGFRMTLNELQEWSRQLQGIGAKMTTEIDSGYIGFFITDPEGNRLEFFWQETPA